MSDARKMVHDRLLDKDFKMRENVVVYLSYLGLLFDGTSLMGRSNHFMRQPS